MRAARYYGIQDIRIEQIPEPETQKGQIKVRNATYFNGKITTYIHTDCTSVRGHLRNGS
jgi:hypothetical protein